MAFPPSLPVLVDAASGGVMVALAALVALRAPPRRANRAFAAFLGAFGVGFLVYNLVDPGDPLRPPLALAAAAASVVGTAAAVVVAWAFPRPLRRADRGPLAVLAATAVTVVAARLVFPPPLATATHPGPFFFMAEVIVLPVLALRFRAAAEGDAVGRSQLALVSSAFALYAALNLGISLALRPVPGITWLLAAILAATTAIWLASAALPHPGASRLARNAALVVPVCVLAGMVLSDLLGLGSNRQGVSGALRAATVAVLAYAMVRHQLLDLDVKVKWTVRQSTVAAAFVGVFFVVSESAATFLSSTDLGPYVGIAAAGLLAFALAPLQRAAERVADAALPGVRPLEQLGQDDRQRLYRDAARQAWADGSISRDERALLALLRQRLRLAPEVALRLEEEAAAEPAR